MKQSRAISNQIATGIVAALVQTRAYVELTLIMLVLFLTLAACGQETDTGNQKADSTNISADSAGVSTITLAELQKIIENRDGKPLVLNMWATWCVPCKEEFPDLVRLAEKTEGSAEVVGVSLDFPDEISSLVVPFLQENPVNFPVFVADVADQDEFINTLNPDWSGALPTTFIYDATGQQTSMMVGKRTLEDFETAVSQAASGGRTE